MLAQELIEPGPRDQRSVENRDDVLVYSIGPLAQDLDVTGPVKATLFVKSTAVDTDFTGKLVDVAPDGFAMDVAEGILRMRYRDSREHGSLMNPGQTYQITLDLWATSNVFPRGHTLRLEISSSNFPRFDRNLNRTAVGQTLAGRFRKERRARRGLWLVATEAARSVLRFIRILSIACHSKFLLRWVSIGLIGFGSPCVLWSGASILTMASLPSYHGRFPTSQHSLVGCKTSARRKKPAAH